jgi:hypothetical protein
MIGVTYQALVVLYDLFAELYFFDPRVTGADVYDEVDYRILVFMRERGLNLIYGKDATGG